MRVRRSFSRTPVNALCLLVAYTLTLSLFAPFATPRVEAATANATPIGEKPAGVAVTKNIKRAARRDDELIVRFRQNTSEQERTALVESKGARRVRKLRKQTGTEKLRLQRGKNLEAVAAELRQSPGVELVEFNYLVEGAQLTANDARFAEQWALKNTGQTGGLAGADINAPAAWETTTGAPSTVIAVVDSGVDFTHPDLQNNRWSNTAEQLNGEDDDGNGLVDDLSGWDFVAGDNDARDEHGHGTMMAGVIAAEGNNWTGTTGVMWRASLMSLRVLNNTGTGDVAAAVEAIDYAVEEGAQVINCSWGTDGDSRLLREAIERAGQRGVVIITAAGNSGRDITSEPLYPASYNLPNVIAVASTDNSDQLAPWSNYSSTQVTVAAPGVDVLTTEVGVGYRTATGSSVSAALVTGVVGLVRTVRPWLGPAETKAAVAGGARQVPSLAGKVSSGGVVSARGALDSLPAPGPTPTPTPGGGLTPGEPAPEGMPDLDAYRDQEPVDPVAPTQIVANTLPVCDADCGDSIPPAGTTNPLDTDFSTERLDPVNATGDTSVNLLSRNFNWGIPVVSLLGRSGLDLSLALVYNSLVWTKQGGAIRFNADRGFPTAGFRLGFPVIQQRYLNSDTGKYAYMMVTPSGSRVELRQVGTSTAYESADGSYIRMIEDAATGGALVLAPDGTKMTYGPFVNNEMHCTEVKDRNGNYLSIAYNTLGRPTSITDTLNRTVTFVYDANKYLTYIRQTWNGVTHNWAIFTYGTLPIQTNFTGLAVEGPANGASIPVLTQVRLHDNSSYTFEYTSWGQVWKISNKAADGHTLNYTYFNLPQDAGTALTDCPRPTQQYDWAEDWNGDTDATPAPAEEALTQYSTASNGSSGQVTFPDGTIYKELYATTDWQRGLSTGTEVWACATAACTTRQKVKWTSALWTQDDTAASYSVNPRPYETNVYDNANNRRRTAISYTSYSLPSDVTEYDKDAATPVRKTHTEYNLSTTYINNATNRRIIGLVTKRQVFDAADDLASQMEYQYDEGGAYFVTADTPIRHDDSLYGTTFIAGRGNLTSVRRVSAPALTPVSEWNIGYNVAGSPVLQRDPLSHYTYVDYTDNFSDATKNQGTYAYPKTVTNPGGSSSTKQYHYDHGAVTKTSVPSSGTTTVTYLDHQMTYDTAGRLTKVLNMGDSSYTRWVYPTSQTLVLQYQTVNTANSAGELYSTLVFDGAGRTLGTSAEHTFGTTPTYRGQQFVYDKMGRQIKQSNPTEMTNLWAAAGDDVNTGWVYTEQTYDWKGRPLKTTNTDGTFSEMEYGGCGCAGGEVTTVKGEQVPQGRRQQKTYTDVLGRVVKTEVLNWNGSVYSTVKNTYNVRDQVTLTRQYAGADAITNTNFQDTVMTYDGHGRLASKKLPQQDAATTYTYNTDDTLLRETDGRGAYATYTYNSRHLVTKIAYAVPAGVTGVPATTAVNYTYDAAGHRESMTDDRGSVTYTYDPLSRLTSEERHINALAGNTTTGGDYKLSYEYTLTGDLKKITDPFGDAVNYGYDGAGRLSSVTGSPYANVTSYITGIKYRARGAIKEANFGGAVQTVQYNTRLKPTQYRFSQYRYDYSYYEDGRLKKFTDLDDITGQPSQVTFHYMSRVYSYDHTGRMSGVGQDPNVNVPAPFVGAYGYDAFGNLTSRNGHFALNPDEGDSSTYTNNRRGGWTYDDDGRVTASSDGSTGSSRAWTYDAAGNKVSVAETASGVTTTNTLAYDGDGLLVYESVVNQYTSKADYLIQSSVLKQVVTKLTAAGDKDVTYVLTKGLGMGLQSKNYAGNETLSWVYRDPLGVQEDGKAYDPFGSLIHNVQPPSSGPQPYVPFYGATYGGASWSSFSTANNLSSGCVLDGAPTDCNRVRRAYNDGLVNLDQNSFNPWTESGKRNLPPGLIEYPVGEEKSGFYHMFITGGPDETAGKLCDDRLEGIFGGAGAEFATDHDPSTLRLADGTPHRAANRDRTLDPTEDPGRGRAHIYANKYGDAVPTELHTPNGWSKEERDYYYRDSKTHIPDPPKDELQNLHRFTYLPGSLRSYGYSGGLVISFIHSGPTDEDGTPNRAVRGPKFTKVGIIGAIGNELDVGGWGDGFNHTHIRFYSADKRGRMGGDKDPRTVFCRDLGFR